MITNPVIKNILARRSVRAFTAQQLSDEELKTLLGLRSVRPHGGNSQRTRFLVIQARNGWRN